ncbi:MAG: PEP-CTERM sorting domain-containing protein [Candidatus Eisenbacteria bacterium]|uniref:PEP-CTERM sorting domain-containing protein n=1 Tax=Eiseniibacteriota bacterium TaxID=2212470 RepID=A0A956SD71_UNCEI|nr:PEP-CTERM sorting domain-containing protein [Candidatus Eisenbacteria bacterium]MCB9462318.1 PEP-CTERM sorting domain-containing protein [Candidatus Eisenbacteria bacterium]
MFVRKLSLSASAAIALLGVAAATSWAGPIYSWNWNAGDPGSLSNNGGRINWVETTFDTNSNTLSWYGNFGNGTRLRTDGFTLTLRSGDSPRTAAGEVAQLYFDGRGLATNPTQVPKLTAYGHNGLTYYSSYMDGAPQAGVQAPDRLATSTPPASAWVHSMTAQVNGDGSRTFGFEIDVTDIVDHSPAWPGTNAWSGIGFGESIGLYMQTFGGLQTSYADGYLTGWSRSAEGFLEISNGSTETVTDPVPEPATLTLLGMGVAGLFGSRLRKRRQA